MSICCENWWDHEESCFVSLSSNCKVQFVGLYSPSHIIFARIAPLVNNNFSSCEDYIHNTHGSSDSVQQQIQPEIGQIVQVVIDDIRKHLKIDDIEAKNEGGASFKLKNKLISSQNWSTSGSHEISKELLQLGSIWLLKQDNNNNKEATASGATKKVRTRSKKEAQIRLKEDDFKLIPDWSCNTLRIHLLPIRFPAAHTVVWSHASPRKDFISCIDGFDQKQIACDLPARKEGIILFEHHKLGFAVLEKPGSVPCHPTVYNEVENILSMFRSWKISQRGSEGNDVYTTLPQRLDILTHGLLIVSTRKEFASYMAKQLEEKTKRHLDETSTRMYDVSKRYRCLVYFKASECIALLDDIVKAKTIVTHYLNVSSSVPKKFTKDPPSSPKGWLKCQLRITSMSNIFNNINDCVTNDLAEMLWGLKGPEIVAERGIKNLVELEIDLLTGRTHQIRGQLATMGIPVVGDMTYGGPGSSRQNPVIGELVDSRLALQCCEVSFYRPEQTWVQKKKKFVYFPSSSKFLFRLETAWWTRYLEEYSTKQNK